jgi:hypothetical protein
MSNYFENPVELVNHTGGDIAHAKAAWVSTGGMTEEKRARMPALLKSMAEQGHGTPFEHSQLTFLVTSEIASHIQAIRHRAGISFNVESARYREIKDDRLYIPLDWPVDVRARLRRPRDGMLRCVPRLRGPARMRRVYPAAAPRSPLGLSAPTAR